MLGDLIGKEDWTPKCQEEDRLRRSVRVVRVLEYLGPLDEMQKQLEYRIQDKRNFGNVSVTLLCETRLVEHLANQIEVTLDNIFTVEKVFQLLHEAEEFIHVCDDPEAADSIHKKMFKEFLTSVVEGRCPNIQACARAMKEGLYKE